MKNTLMIATALFSLSSIAVAETKTPVMLTDAQLDTLTAAGAPENPGQAGQTNAFFSKGFQKVLAAKGLVAATYLFGNSGKGNGADPDPLGLATDHDPGVIGGAPDMTR